MFNNKIIPQKYILPINCVRSAVEAEQINMLCTCVKVSDFFFPTTDADLSLKTVRKRNLQHKFTAQYRS